MNLTCLKMIQRVINFSHIDLILEHKQGNVIREENTRNIANLMQQTESYFIALKNLRNAAISFADSTVFIFLPCFSDMLCNNSFAPALHWPTKPVS